MKEILDNIQKQIDQSIDLPVDVQKELLEPLFDEVYQNCRNSDIDIKDLLKLSQLENQLTGRIVDVNPILEPSANLNADVKAIEQLIYYSRKKIENIYQCSIVKDSLRSRSLDCSKIVLENAKNLGISASIFNLGEYFNFPIKHYIVIAYLNEKYYIIDITYQQFFLLGYNLKNRYYEHPSYTRVCEVGGIMITNHKDTAIQMIKDGYLMDEIDIKKYFDAFMECFNKDKLNSGYEYLKIILSTLKGSSDKVDRILYSKMNF